MKQERIFIKFYVFMLAIVFMLICWDIETYANAATGSHTISINTDYVSDGTVTIEYDGDSDAKAILSYNGNKVYTYSIPSKTKHIIPMAYGDGTYNISVYKHLYGNQYYIIASQSLNVSMDDELSPYLSPNAVVSYDDDMELIQEATCLKSLHSDVSDYISSVYQYVSQYDYDYEKANAINSSADKNYVPDVESIYHENKGICFDYAAVMVAMLRSQGIPAKIEFGFVNGLYHAWVNVYQYDKVLDSYIWKLYDPTFASSADPATLAAYMQDPSNYKPICVN